MRLIQVKNVWDDENLALFSITRDTISDEKAETLIRDNFNGEGADEVFNENNLEAYGIERVFCTDMYVAQPK